MTGSPVGPSTVLLTVVSVCVLCKGNTIVSAPLPFLQLPLAVVLLLAATIALIRVHVPPTLRVAASAGACPNASNSATPANERFHYRCKPRRRRRGKALSCRYCSAKRGRNSPSLCESCCFKLRLRVALSSACQADSRA